MRARLVFSKLGRARWLSHLDVMRVLQRSLKRVGVPMEYSNGYNPHIRMSLPIPCPTGVESLCEICDLGVKDGYDLSRLKLILPEGFKLRYVTAPDVAAKDIKWIDYRIELFRETGEREVIEKRLSAQNPTEKPAALAEGWDAYIARRLTLRDDKGNEII